jgi:hypothetical protein
VSVLRIKKIEAGVVLPVRLQPRASGTEICGCIEHRLKIKVVAPPLEGRANKECIEFLAKKLGISKSGLRVISGAKSREKRILIPLSGMDCLVRTLKSKSIDFEFC